MQAFEAIAQRQTLSTMKEMYDCARGTAAYPWELPGAQQPRAWRHSRLRAVLLPCLSRDPDARPAAAELMRSVTRMGHATTLQSLDADTGSGTGTAEDGFQAGDLSSLV